MKTYNVSKIGRAILALITLFINLNLISCVGYPPPVAHQNSRSVGGFSGSYERSSEEFAGTEVRRPDRITEHSSPTDGRKYSPKPSAYEFTDWETGKKFRLSADDPRALRILDHKEPGHEGTKWVDPIYRDHHRDSSGRAMPGPGDRISGGETCRPTAPRSNGGYHRTPDPGCVNEYGETREDVLRAMNAEGIATYHTLPPPRRR